MTFRTPLLLALLAALTGCSSDDAASGGQKAMSDSMASRMLRPDLEKRSKFESSLTASNSGMGSYMEKQGFKTDEFNQTSKYKVRDARKPKSFSGADDQNGLQRQDFSGADDTSNLADGNFKTDAMHGSDQVARQGAETFRGGDDSFRTGEVRDAAKSQAQNKRPLIVKPDGAVQPQGRNYSEEEVRLLLNRN